MAKYEINYMMSGLQPINMEADFYALEDEYFVFKNKGPKTVFIIHKQYVGSILTKTETEQ